MARRPDPSARLLELAGDAPRQSRNVRALARFAANSNCATARLGFAARVDFDRLLVGTTFEAPFGQSPFAFRRGNQFEQRLRHDDHAPLRALLEEHLGYPTAGARVVNVREPGKPQRGSFARRAERTQELIRAIVDEAPDAPNLIDGAVLARTIGGSTSYFEADAVAASFDGPIHAGEVKSFPTVDGQADPDKLGAAIAQVAIYILLLRELVDRSGGDPDRVSADALIITPRNTGLQPTMSVKSVGREVDRARRILDSVADQAEWVPDLPPTLPAFASIAELPGRSESQRVDRALEVIDGVGNCYQPGCMSSCGFGLLCRDRAHERGDLVRIGTQFLRIVPGVESIDRVGELARGEEAQANEVPAAEQLRRAQALLDASRPTAPKPRRPRAAKSPSRPVRVEKSRRTP